VTKINETIVAVGIVVSIFGILWLVILTFYWMHAAKSARTMYASLNEDYKRLNTAHSLLLAECEAYRQVANSASERIMKLVHSDMRGPLDDKTVALVRLASGKGEREEQRTAAMLACQRIAKRLPR